MATPWNVGRKKNTLDRSFLMDIKFENDIELKIIVTYDIQPNLTKNAELYGKEINVLFILS